MDIYNLVSTYGKGLGDAKMWESIKVISDELAPMKETHQKQYWKILRRMYGVMSGGHYNQEFAEHDVAQIEYNGKDGKVHYGAYWTAEQVEEAMKAYTLPNGVNKWDLFVAANVLRSDLCKKFDDAQVLDATYLFFLKDEDWPNPATKIWDYMCCKWTK